jgi:hypothetical protein
MDNIFSHPDFHLIFINNNGMSLISPRDYKEGILKDGYRCISHYWGNAKPFRWVDHGIEGVEWGVDVREEKRERVMEVFKYHKGYFWMDVFCTNQDTNDKALDIMGDIYKNCKECICLLDYECKVKGYKSERDILHSLTNIIYKSKKAKLRFHSLPHHMLDETKTHVKSFFGEDSTEYTIVLSEINAARQIYQEFSTNEHAMYDDLSAKWDEIDSYISSIDECQWFNRVWTLQEALLPTNVSFISEIAGNHKYAPIDKYTFMRDDKEVFEDYKFGEARGIGLDDTLRCVVKNIFKDMTRDELLAEILSSFRMCSSEPDYVYGISGLLNISIPDKLTLEDGLFYMFVELQKQGIYTLFREDINLKPNNLYDLYKNYKFVDRVYTIGKSPKSDTRYTNFGYITNVNVPYSKGIACEAISGKKHTNVYRTTMGQITSMRDLDLRKGDLVEVIELSKGNTHGFIGWEKIFNAWPIVEFVDEIPIFVGIFETKLEGESDDESDDESEDDVK